MIKRCIHQPLLDDLGRGKPILLLGPRRIGKSTLLRELSAGRESSLFIDCDDLEAAALLIDKSASELERLISPFEFVFINQAQRVKNVGLTLKKIIDLKLDTQLVATSSTSLALAGDGAAFEPAQLVERRMFPLTLPELAAQTSEREERRLLESRMIYGLYPEVVAHPERAKQTLSSLIQNYLYYDVYDHKSVRKPTLLHRLLRALALKIGNVVTYNELASELGGFKERFFSYVVLLVKCYVILKFDSFHLNFRCEAKKGKKIYFYDNGLRNALISAFAPLDYRSDAPALWENLMMAERMKRNFYAQSPAHPYFWRTHDRKEIDLIEEADGALSSYDFKWTTPTLLSIISVQSSPKGSSQPFPKPLSQPAPFAAAYPSTPFTIITPENFWPFLRL